MTKNFQEAIKNRRSCYSINNKCSLSNEQLQEMVDFALQYVPSAFNSQSARLVLLTGQHHKKLWGTIVMETLRAVAPSKNFEGTEKKINAFGAGYGTILFYEDQTVVEGLQNQFPTYSDKFPIWSEHTSAMHQFTLWTMLEENGLGASLQHYNPIIDQRVSEEWSIDPTWKLIAQMPFGGLVEAPAPIEKIPAEKRRKFFV